MIKVEALVLKNLLLDEEYVRKALPFLKREYFQDTENKSSFRCCRQILQRLQHDAYKRGVGNRSWGT